MNQETGPETVQRMLASYDLGAKLRKLRLKKKIALADLGKHTGLSPSLLSQLENGKLIPTLPTLARIGMVFDVGMEHFFGYPRELKLFSVVRAADRMRFPERPDVPVPSYFFECLAFATQGKGMNAYLAEFPQTDAEPQEHFHEGAEFIFVLEGKLLVTFQKIAHELGAGDSVHFDSSEPHSYQGITRKSARAVVMTLPLRI